jgi:hypothetical protein
MKWQCPNCKRRYKVPLFPVRCACGFRAESADSVPDEPRAAPPLPWQSPSGPGAELTKLLATVGIHYTAGCKCRDRSKKMDAMGVQWCRDNIDTIVDWMGEEAKKRHLPFMRIAAKLMAKRAIRRAAVAQKPVRWIPSSEISQAVRHVIKHLPSDVGGIVAVPRSGVPAAALLAMELHVPLYHLSASGLVQAKGGARTNKGYADGTRLVLVDDSSCTGTSLKQLKSTHQDIDNMFKVVLFSTPATAGNWDLVYQQLTEPHFFEWNFFNSTYITSAALDLDGILCHNGSDAPRWLPRRSPAKAIITARTEPERQGTEAWLAKWGILYERLVMFPGTAEERTPAAVAKYKASEVQKAGAAFYVESEPGLSDMLRERGVRVLCPDQGYFR